MDVKKRAAIAISGLALTGAAALTLGSATAASADPAPGPQAAPSTDGGYGYPSDGGAKVKDNQTGNVNSQQNNFGSGFNKNRQKDNVRKFKELEVEAD